MHKKTALINKNEKERKLVCKQGNKVLEKSIRKKWIIDTKRVHEKDKQYLINKKGRTYLFREKWNYCKKANINFYQKEKNLLW